MHQSKENYEDCALEITVEKTIMTSFDTFPIKLNKTSEDFSLSAVKPKFPYRCRICSSFIRFRTSLACSRLENAGLLKS